MLRFFGLDVEVQSDDRPHVAMLFARGLLDQRPDALEKVVAHRRFLTGETKRRFAGLVVGDERSAHSSRRIAEPHEILLDGERRAGRQCPIDPVGPATVVGITVMCIEQHACTRLEGRVHRRRADEKRARRHDPCCPPHHRWRFLDAAFRT